MMMDVCLRKLPVTLMIDQAGWSAPSSAATHQGAFDMATCGRCQAWSSARPGDVRDLRQLIRLSLEHDGPMAIRYAQAADDMGPNMQENTPLEVGRWELPPAGRTMILAVRRMVETALNAAIKLVGKGVLRRRVDARFIKPMDEEMLREAHRPISC